MSGVVRAEYGHAVAATGPSIRYAVGRGSMALAALILGGITVASSAFWALVWLTI